MRIFLVLCLLFSSLSSFADSVVTTQIHDIDMGQINEEPLIFLTSGQVVTYPASNKSMMDEFRNAIVKKTWFEFTLNDERQIVSYKALPPQLKVKRVALSSFKTLSLPYEPSILKNMDVARSFFYDARMTQKKESQCFNRAHVWSYEWRTKKNLYSSKAWLFFTRRFIRKYKFEWWFHVAPMVHVVVDGAVRERVMDIKYARGPIKLKQWTDIFMRDNADCPVVEKYSEQANHPESGSCFLMKSSMYYYQPVDLEELDVLGTEKTKWLQPEVKNAYLEAFDEEI